MPKIGPQRGCSPWGTPPLPTGGGGRRIPPSLVSWASHQSLAMGRARHGSGSWCRGLTWSGPCTGTSASPCRPAPSLGSHSQAASGIQHRGGVSQVSAIPEWRVCWGLTLHLKRGQELTLSVCLRVRTGGQVCLQFRSVLKKTKKIGRRPSTDTAEKINHFSWREAPEFFLGGVCQNPNSGGHS